MNDHRVFLHALQSNNIVQLFEKGIEYEMAQMSEDPEICKYCSVKIDVSRMTSQSEAHSV